MKRMQFATHNRAVLVHAPDGLRIQSCVTNRKAFYIDHALYLDKAGFK